MCLRVWLRAGRADAFQAALGFQATFVGIGAVGRAGIDGRQGLDTNGKASSMNVRPTTFCGEAA